MDYRKFGTTYVMRLDPGDEIVEKVLWLSAVEHIKLATVTGLGAVDNVTLGIYSPDTKQFKANMFHADFEIVSLTGTITTQRSRPYAHLHMAVGDLSGRCYGGHLNRAVVSATAEQCRQNRDDWTCTNASARSMPASQSMAAAES